jgi:hypothetical protein
MRTTVTLTPQAEALIKATMAESGRSFKDVVNGAIVSGLAPARTGPFRTKARALGRFDPRRVGLDRPPEKALTLAAALEDQELARKRDSGK